MNKRTERLKDIFSDAIAMSEDERNALLASLHPHDPDLASELASLLEAHRTAGGFLSPLYPSPPDNLPDPRIGMSVGPYRISRLVGRGGMGEVYEAVRDDGAFDMNVAIKLMRYDASPADLQRRFVLERKTLARLEHPNIARLLDGGTLPDGIPYLVMEFISGKRIDEYCDEQRLTLEQRLKLFLEVCSAVRYAHQHLVIHRDLKSTNILVTPGGTPKLLDFGIAKLLSGTESTSHEEATSTGPAPLTPEYASPEQIRGEEITTSSDVYALGVLLYKMCTGQNPYDFKSPLPHDVAATILETEPIKPWQREILISSTETRERLRQKLSGDFWSILLMALRKEPQRRYHSVEQFAEDVERYLRGMPVLARPNTFSYRASRFIRRNRIVITAGCLVFLVLLGGLIATMYQVRVVEAEKAKAESINKFLEQFLNHTSPRKHIPVDTSHETTMKEMLDEAAQRINSEGVSIQPEIRAELERTLGESYGDQGRYDLMYQHMRNYIALQEQLYGENDPKSLDARGMWAGDLFAQGKMDESEREFRHVIPQMRRALHDGTIRAEVLATSLNNFGYLRRTQGDSHEAEEAFREVLSLSPMFSSESHFVIGITRSTLASTLSDQGKFEEALQTAREAVTDYHRGGDTSAPDFGFMLTILGGFLTEEGALDSAQSVLHEAEGIFRKTVGSTHLWLGDNLRNQAALLCRKGNYRGALETINEAIQIYLHSFGSHYDHYPTALMIRGLALNGMCKKAEAETVLRDALKQRMESLPKGHLFTALTQSALGECLASEGKFVEAETLLLTAYHDLVISQGQDNPKTTETKRRLAALYDRWKKPKLAARYRG